jgi:hypothetical protein
MSQGRTKAERALERKEVGGKGKNQVIEGGGNSTRVATTWGMRRGCSEIEGGSGWERHAARGGGGLIVYMCAACGRQGGAGQRTQGTAARVQLRGWMGDGGVVASEKGSRSERASTSGDGGNARRAQLDFWQAGRSAGPGVAAAGGSWSRDIDIWGGMEMLTVMGTLRVRSWKTRRGDERVWVDIGVTELAARANGDRPKR